MPMDKKRYPADWLRIAKSVKYCCERELEDLPSAQPDIIRCKDCMWYEIYELKKDGTEDRRYKPSFCTLYDRLHDPDWFCGDGVRREKTNDKK